jgi:hypothetical protein
VDKYEEEHCADEDDQERCHCRDRREGIDTIEAESEKIQLFN